jgi:3-deoxy-D-manno-octulosonic acid kinase
MLSEKLTWGALPSGFAKRTDGNGNLMIVRQERQKQIGFDICLDQLGTTEASRYQGRGALTALRLPDGETALVRQYRHGGVLRGLNPTWFFTWPPRPFRELTVTEELRRRGLRTVEVFAACVSRGRGPFYRGWLVSKELPGAVDLWSALQQGFLERIGAEAAWRAVADTIRAMHREGVYHGDLNLKNILLRQEADSVVSYIIDFDKALLFLGKLPTELAKKNLDRLLRSAHKLDAERRFVSPAVWQRFGELYYECADG